MPQRWIEKLKDVDPVPGTQEALLSPLVTSQNDSFEKSNRGGCILRLNVGIACDPVC